MGDMDVYQAKDPGVNITANSKPSKQCVSTMNKAREELSRSRSTMSWRELDVLDPLNATIVRPHLECCAEAWEMH